MEILEPLAKILMINLVLSGDNAVVIAMASRNLRDDLKKKAIFFGTMGAVVFRIIFTVIVMYLMQLPFIHLIGGLLLLLVAYKLLVDVESEDTRIKIGSSLQEAIVIIIFADLLMSLDNVLGIVAVANNNMVLVIIGIILSIPIMLYASQFILRLMEKYSGVVYFGAALLAWTAGEMMLKEEVLHDYIRINATIEMVMLIGIVFITLSVGAFHRKYR
ncbi:YjbE family putative metal transport protein [Ornithinibacillus contaminans]|uniref:YjbE family putative metal transport protein n=1 Tax=Ornithinibacillus contaminans TaxID=694055 RepID=UPI0009F8A1B3|nr:YjbE family putative metal transport protein [Ornithinibacillus contaminans]